MQITTRDASGGGYWFSKKDIDNIEERYNAKYMGFWCTKRPSGGWNDTPVDVFYVENPDTSKGHSNYFGMFVKSPILDEAGTVYITNAESAFSEPMDGLLSASGVVYVSRYRHNYIAVDEGFIDGGRDYTRYNPDHSTFVIVTVKDGEFIFSDPAHKEIDPDLRDWEYSGDGRKVHKGTNKSYE